MRLQSIHLPVFKNLRDFKCEFETSNLVTVLLGGNGTGKSNLIEALVNIFRDLDLGDPPSFPYMLSYMRGDCQIVINAGQTRKETKITVDGKSVSYAKFTSAEGSAWRPSHVFGYYSGPSGRLERLFDKHQENFYKALINADPAKPDEAAPLRRLFYARPVHSQFVLLSFFCRQEERHRALLQDLLGIERLESVLFVIRQPPKWGEREPNAAMKQLGDDRFWYARGTVKGFLGKLHELALAPVRFDHSVPVGLRGHKTLEHVFLYLRDMDALTVLAADYPTTADFFKTLESTYISDLLAEVRIRVWVRKADGALTFRELSEGEQQLLTVLGLLEFTREEESLFLLDEPDTHLNPLWSFDYVKHLRKIVGDQRQSQLLMATHDPLVICGLVKEQVRVMRREDDGQITANQPDLDPQGLGVAGILTSDMFGLSSTIDSPTLEKINQRLILHARRAQWTEEERLEYSRLSTELSRLGFQYELSDPYFMRFSEAMARRYAAKMGKMTPSEQKELDAYADQLLEQLMKED